MAAKGKREGATTQRGFVRGGGLTYLPAQKVGPQCFIAQTSKTLVTKLRASTLSILDWFAATICRRSGSVIVTVVPPVHHERATPHHHEVTGRVHSTQSLHFWCASSSTFFCPTWRAWSSCHWLKVDYRLHRNILSWRHFWRRRVSTLMTWPIFAQFRISPSCRK